MATSETTILAVSLSATETGDTFFIPKGTPCTWEITKKLRKFYMIADV